MTTRTTTRTTTTTTRTRTRTRRRTRSNNNNDDNEDAARSMSCPQVQMKSPSLFPSPDPYRHRRCAKLYNIYMRIYIYIIDDLLLYDYYLYWDMHGDWNGTLDYSLSNGKSPYLWSTPGVYMYIKDVFTRKYFSKEDIIEKSMFDLL